MIRLDNGEFVLLGRKVEPFDRVVWEWLFGCAPTTYDGRASNGAMGRVGSEARREFPGRDGLRGVRVWRAVRDRAREYARHQGGPDGALLRACDELWTVTGF